MEDDTVRSKLPSLREFCLYSIAANLDRFLFKNIAENDAREMLYVLGPSACMSNLDTADLVDILLKGVDHGLMLNHLHGHFRATLRTGHLYALLHQQLSMLCLVKCGSLVTSALLTKLAERTLPLSKLELASLSSKSVSKHSICQLITSCCKRLFTLTMVDCQRIGTEVISSIADTCTNLRMLTLSGCSSLSAVSLAPFHQAPLRKTLVHLDLAGVNIDSRFLKAILLDFLALKSLNLNGSCYGVAVSSIILDFNKDRPRASLQSLDLSHSDINDAAASRIASLYPQLHRLSLLGCCELTSLTLSSLQQLRLLSVLEFGTGNDNDVVHWLFPLESHGPLLNYMTRLSLREENPRAQCRTLSLSQLNAVAPNLISLELSQFTLDLAGFDSTPIFPVLETLTLECKLSQQGDEEVFSFVELFPGTLQRVRLVSPGITMNMLSRANGSWLQSAVELALQDADGMPADVVRLLERCPSLELMTVITKPLCSGELAKACRQFKNVDIVGVFLQPGDDI